MTNQVALVTGSSRGIGLGIAESLVKKGFAVALNGPCDDEELTGALAHIVHMGGKAIKIPFDVSDSTRYISVLDKIENELGAITTLVNNAGVGVLSRGDMLEVSEESYDRCMAVNTKAMFFLSQVFAKRFLSRMRDPSLFYAIINITSSNARAVASPRTEYAVSKAAAAMVTQALAVRLGAEGMHVYDVQPGLIATEMTSAVIKDYEKRTKDGLTLLPRIGHPKDIGKIVASLASGALPYVTGQVISADGGLLVSRF